MKKKIKHKVVYTDDLGDAADFEGARILTREEERALGIIPSPEEAKTHKKRYSDKCSFGPRYARRVN